MLAPCKNHLIAILFQLIFLVPSLTFAGGYIQNLYLCDLGIMNPDRSNTRGVDFVNYVQREKKLAIRATPSWSSAMELANNQGENYSPWDNLAAINDVSFNFESEFYGTEYFLEYCYIWDRIEPLESIQYTIKIKGVVKTEIPNTKFETNTICSIKFKDGSVGDNINYPRNEDLELLLEPEQVGIRCTVRLNFKESTRSVYRPHNNDLGEINPRVQVKVEP